MIFVAHLCQKWICGHLGDGTSHCVRLLGQITLFCALEKFHFTRYL